MNAGVRIFLVIVLGAIGFACLLGIALDLVTANVAVEYFTVHHPRIVASDNPWVLAIVWGIAASWWFGAIAGAVVATVNQRRPEPLPPLRILKWTFFACVVLWLIMIGILLAALALSNLIPLEQRRPTFESDRRLIAVALAHQSEYVLGAIAGLIIAVMTWRAKTKSNAETF